MPRVEILNGFRIDAQKSAEPEKDGMVEIWSLYLTDRQSGDLPKV